MSGASEQQSKSTVAQYWASQQKNLQKISMVKEGHEQSEEEDHQIMSANRRKPNIGSTTQINNGASREWKIHK
jgi:hypothetical protein